MEDRVPRAPETPTDILPSSQAHIPTGHFQTLICTHSHTKTRLHNKVCAPRSALLLVGIKSLLISFYHFEFIISAFFSLISAPHPKVSPVPLFCAGKVPAPFLCGIWQSSSPGPARLFDQCLPPLLHLLLQSAGASAAGLQQLLAPCLAHSKSFINMCGLLE